MAPKKKRIASAACFVIISVLIEKQNSKMKKRKHRFWTSHFLKTRQSTQLLNDVQTNDRSGLFKNFCRMSVQDFDFLNLLIGPKICRRDTNYRESIPVEVRLAITLRFLATGDSYNSLMYLFRVSKQLISKIIPEVCAHIIEALGEHIKMPDTEQMWLQVSEQFERQWNFPHAIGAIDGKHVVIQCPAGSGSDFFNYKSFFSIVLFALVDANYNFLFVDVGCQGRISDGGVFKNTQLYKGLQNGYFNLPPPKILPGYETPLPYVILGDEAFALNDNLMKPYSGLYEKGSKQRIFNYRLSRARRVVENAFGICSSVFRVLRKPLLLKPANAQLVVMACVHLHNFLRKSPTSKNVYCPEGALDIEVNGKVIPGTWRNDNETSSLCNLRKIPRKSSTSAQEIRNEFSAYFVGNGTVPWQNEYA